MNRINDFKVNIVILKNDKISFDKIQYSFFIKEMHTLKTDGNSLNIIKVILKTTINIILNVKY